MSQLIWNATGQRFYEAGVDRGVLYPNKGFPAPWNGLIDVTEKVSGGEPKPYYIDGVKYLNEAEVEEFEASIEAYTYPDAFAELDGTASDGNGLSFGLQPRKDFGLSYRTKIGNDLSPDFGYKIHLIYNATASPTERKNSTLGSSVDPGTFNWGLTAIPVWVPGRKPTAHLIIDSTKVDRDLLSYVEGHLYGSQGIEPRLPTPYELVTIFGSWQALGLSQPLNFLGEIQNESNWVTNLYLNPSFETGTGNYNRRVNYVSNPNMVPGGTTVDIRTNLAKNPNSVVSTGWFTAGGTSPVGATNQDGGPTGKFARLTQGAVGSGTNYFAVAYGQPGTSFAAVVPGTNYVSSAYVRVNIASGIQQPVIRMRWKDAAGATLNSDVSVQGAGVVNNVWARLSVSGVAPVNAAYVEVMVGFTAINLATLGVGDTVDMTGVLVEASLILEPYFDGGTAAGGDYTYVWSGTVNASVSIQRALSLTGPYAKDSGTANGPIFASTEQAKNGTTSIKCIAATASGDVGFAYSVPPSNLVVGTVYTVSWWVYSPSARTASFDCTRSAEGNNRGLTNIPANVWTEVRGTFTFTAGTNIAVPFWLHHKAGPLAAGEVIYVDCFMIYDGAIPLPYFDGGTTDTGAFDYIWSGTPNASNSQEVVTRAANANHTSGQTLAYLATDVTYGKVWQHLIQNVAAYGVNADIPGLTSGQEYTILIRARPSRDMQVKPRIYSVQSSGSNYVLPANVWTDIRATITPDAYNQFSGLIGPGASGHQPGDILEIAQLLIVEGNYTGPFFDGASPNFVYLNQEVVTEWTGTPNASTSRAAYLSELPLNAKPGDGYTIEDTEYLTVLESGYWRKYVLIDSLTPEPPVLE